jgi:IS5 family transposase
MSQPRDDRQDDLFRSSLEAIINLRHPLVRLAAEINLTRPYVTAVNFFSQS